MITRIEALNYRCLRHVACDLGPFHILVGPNASGKSTFLDVPGLMRDLVQDGRQDIGDVISSRAPNYEDLLWKHEGQRFKLTIEATVPESLRHHLPGGQTHCMYDLEIGSIGRQGELGISKEYLGFFPPLSDQERRDRVVYFPVGEPSPLLVTVTRDIDVKEKEVEFDTETSPDKGFVFSLSHRTCALANLPPDDKLFPVSNWFRQFLVDGVKTIALNPAAMRWPSPPNARRTFVPDGSSIAWLVDQLAPRDYELWLAHLRTELPNLVGIRSVERPEDRHRYLKLRYEGGLEVPSWVVSDGTLEMLALTLLPYLPDKQATYLIEEPENCVHPTAMQAIFESLSSIYDGQVLMATHSPLILGMADLGHVLCFTRDAQGATRVVRGREHRILRNWQGEVNLGTLFASGVME
ncbi:MAG: ATP-binding protein [Planctomycetes bacterium]|nr:ATP-binding protein [Planctomycetota bacterium]